MKRKILIGGAATFALLIAVLLIFDVGEVIDLPSWANVGGIDIPLIGDTDVLDCRLSAVDGGSANVEVTIVDGDSATYPDFAHVWWNGNLVDPELLERPSDDMFIAPGEAGEQFYAISKLPDANDRTFCESIVLG